MVQSNDALRSFTIDASEFGRVRVRTVPLPDHVQDPSATYSATGAVVVLYRTGSVAESDQYGLAVLDDSGEQYREVFRGEIPEHPKANGVRHMPFADNRGLMLGDYVLECTPDIDNATSARLVPVEYPWGLESDPLTSHHWSEIIIAPDNERFAWTILRADMGAAAAVGRLRRTDDRYLIEDPVLISTVDEFVPDPDHEGYVRAEPLRGGEVKQFVAGGSAISVAGSGGGFLPDSVLQDLQTGEIEGITHTPGYDETTILSPDERLGITMTSRFSPKTDLAVLGLLPRPLAALSGSGVAWSAYFYAVNGVRNFRPGNVGPALIDIKRSKEEPGYRGISLVDPDEDWVYVSPMSWHPSGTRVMWMEMRRGSGDSKSFREMRVRVAELLDRTPATAASVAPPAAAPWGLSGDAAVRALRRPFVTESTKRIAGRATGFAEIHRRSGDVQGTPSETTVRYHRYSDDGARTYDGFEESTSSFTAGTTYRAELMMTGAEEGEMRLQLTWSGIADGARLKFDLTPDGSPLSHGFARFGDETLQVADLIP